MQQTVGAVPALITTWWCLCGITGLGIEDTLIHRGKPLQAAAHVLFWNKNESHLLKSRIYLQNVGFIGLMYFMFIGLTFLMIFVMAPLNVEQRNGLSSQSKKDPPTLWPHPFRHHLHLKTCSHEKNFFERCAKAPLPTFQTHYAGNSWRSVSLVCFKTQKWSKVVLGQRCTKGKHKT